MVGPAGRNAFGDPVTGTVYPWARNHEEEQSGARIRTIDNLQPTISRWRTVRAIRTQGTRDELIYKLAGKCVTLAQHQLFLFFMNLSLTQTIYFFHCAGDVIECQLSDYEPERQYTGGAPAARENYLFIYTMQLDLVQLIG